MFKFNVYTPLIALVMTAALAACGGGSGNGDVGAVGGSAGGPPGAAATSDIPASALASVDGLIAFMNQLIDTGTNDTSEPIQLGDASLPVADTI